MVPPFDRILIDRRSASDELTGRILKNCPDTPVEWTDPESFPGRTAAEDKRVLFLTRSAGGMVKPCPATNPPYLCCRYTVINQTLQCPMDCTYCVLQDYLYDVPLTLHTNLDAIFSEIEDLLARFPGRRFRFGTGELADSLALDPWTGLSTDLIRFFSGKDCLLELKTKTVSIQNLLGHPAANVVISWSLNPQSVIYRDEKDTASLRRRLEAAKECAEAGFLIGFHFDPILRIPNWDLEYRQVVEALFDHVRGERIAWISLGSLRYPPALRQIMAGRFPDNPLAFDEMSRGLDGKLRYPRPLRVEFYRKLAGWIRERDTGVFLYFCMEPPWVWERVLGEVPQSNEDLDFWFARSIHARFPELGWPSPVRSDFVEGIQ